MPPPCPPVPQVIGHRGAAASAPENTLAGFRRARALGCGWVEFDVRLTADGEPIVLHDPRLDRTTDGSGKACRLPLAAIRRHDAGSWFDPAFAGERVPTLAEAIGVLAELGLGANFEIKAERGRERETAAVAAAAIARLWPAHLPAPLISSFLPAAVMAAREAAPGIARGILFRGVPRRWWTVAETLDCTTVHADETRLRRETVAEIRGAGYPLLAYTVNDPARARMLLEWGVGAVFTDAPERILRGLAIPLVNC
jgi:glycerophosphoryl diester phosphodiesterase